MKWREAESERMEEKIIGGRYEYKKSLGKGGMGSVFLCFDTKLQKEWAVKELVEQTAEMELLKTISCNLFPRIVDIVHEQDKLYLVMDYVEGITLKEKMQRQKLTEKEVLTWAIQIAKALLYLHQMSPQILYLDCKPENIMLTPQGEIRLVDLGSVFICGGKKKQRISGTRFFSPAEQQKANQKARKENEYIEQRPDVRSDIYAFGMTMYYLLAGKKKIYRRRGKLSVRDANPAVSEGMNAIIARCTEKDPSKRLQSMEEVLYQLTHIKKINRHQQIRHQIFKMAAMFVKCVCALVILNGAWLYVQRGVSTALLSAMVAAGVFFILCRHRCFTLYEVKKEVFCGSGKRVLLYLLIVFGVLQMMTVTVFAKAHAASNSQKNGLTRTKTEAEEIVQGEQKLNVILYDWKGRKLLLKDGAVWKLSEDILLSVPLEELEETEGKITVLYEGKDNGVMKQYEFLVVENSNKCNF